MLARLFKVVDAFSRMASRLADASVVVLIAAMVYEVLARYVFSAPTVWAYDVAYMCSGALFLLGVSWTLKEDAHIRIDVLRNKLPPRLAGAIEGVVFLLILCPFFGALAWVSINKALHAWLSNEVEMVSPWAPHMWPFYSSIAIGLVALTLQLAVEGLRGFAGQRGRRVEVQA